MCDNINLLIVLKLYDAIDRRAMLSCDNSGYITAGENVFWLLFYSGDQ